MNRYIVILSALIVLMSISIYKNSRLINVQADLIVDLSENVHLLNQEVMKMKTKEKTVEIFVERQFDPEGIEDDRYVVTDAFEIDTALYKEH